MVCSELLCRLEDLQAFFSDFTSEAIANLSPKTLKGMLKAMLALEGAPAAVPNVVPQHGTHWCFHSTHV